MTLHSVPLLEIRAAPEGVISGYASVFGGVDSYGDAIERGAYATSLRKHRAAGTTPSMLWSHKQDQPIGRWTDLAEDDRGLRVVGRLNLKTDAGQQAFEHLRGGDLNGLSIGYTVPQGGSEMRGKVRLLKQIDLHEISPVTIPADGQARIDEVKRAALRPASLREFERALQTLGYSRRQAEQLAAKGFAAVQAVDEIDSAELRAVAAALHSFHNSLKG